MFKPIATSILAVLALATLPSQAQVSDTFDVTVNLTSACRLTTTPGDITLNYTSFAASPASASTSFAVQCTDGFSYDLALSAADASTLGLTIPLVIRNSGDTADVTTTQAQSGTGSTTYLIKASIAAGQQGTCTNATCSSTVSRTLNIVY